MKYVAFLVCLIAVLCVVAPASAQVQSIQIGGGGVQALQAAPAPVFVQPAFSTFALAPVCGINHFGLGGFNNVGVNVGVFGGHRGGFLGGRRFGGERIKQVQRIRR